VRRGSASAHLAAGSRRSGRVAAWCALLRIVGGYRPRCGADELCESLDGPFNVNHSVPRVLSACLIRGASTSGAQHQMSTTPSSIARSRMPSGRLTSGTFINAAICAVPNVQWVLCLQSCPSEGLAVARLNAIWQKDGWQKNELPTVSTTAPRAGHCKMRAINVSLGSDSQVCESGKVKMTQPVLSQPVLSETNSNRRLR
jgi:hypothetical protein